MTTENITHFAPASEELVEHLEELVPFFDGSHDEDQHQAAETIKAQLELYEQDEEVDMVAIYKSVNVLRDELHNHTVTLTEDEKIEAYTVCHHALLHISAIPIEVLRNINA